MRSFVLIGLLAFAAAQNIYEEDFRQMDVNHDGFVTSDELLHSFMEMDLNGDGMVNYDEFTNETDPAEKYTAEERGPFVYFDSLDGQLNDNIDHSDVMVLFGALDADGNGKISLSEYKTQQPKIDGKIEDLIGALDSVIGK